MVDYQRLPYNLDTNEETHSINGGIGELIIQVGDGHRRIQGLVKRIKNNTLCSNAVDVPCEWVHKYNLDRSVLTPAGQFTIIIGQDLNDLMHEDLESCGKISLARSRIDGRFLMHGASEKITSNFGTVTEII